MEYHLDIFKNVDVIVTPTCGYVKIFHATQHLLPNVFRYVTSI